MPSPVFRNGGLRYGKESEKRSQNRGMPVAQCIARRRRAAETERTLFLARTHKYEHENRKRKKKRKREAENNSAIAQADRPREYARIPVGAPRVSLASFSLLITSPPPRPSFSYPISTRLYHRRVDALINIARAGTHTHGTDAIRHTRAASSLLPPPCHGHRPDDRRPYEKRNRSRSPR